MAKRKKTQDVTVISREGPAVDYSEVADIRTLHNAIVQGWLKGAEHLERHMKLLDEAVNEDSPVEVKLMAAKVFATAYSGKTRALALLKNDDKDAEPQKRELPDGLSITELRKLADE